MNSRYMIGIVCTVLLTGCRALQTGQCLSDELRSQIAQDMDAVNSIAIVRLDEAQVTGNWPIIAKGAKIKIEVALDKRVYTRGELWLRGNVVRFLKGHLDADRINMDSESVHMEKGSYLQSSANHVSFDIATTDLVADRHDEVLEIPASNIPDLTIGETYVVMFNPRNSAKLYYTCIWPVNSLEARFIEDRLNNRNRPNRR